MKLNNSLTKQVEEFIPEGDTISMYSCGPTVYNNLHIGNLSAFVYADLLRRVLIANYPGKKVRHVMNVTDVDDKTIRDSKGHDTDPMKALLSFTRKYEQVFMNDMTKIGNNLASMEFIRATESIEEMLDIIRELYDTKIAYIAEDGVYFSIAEYKKRGKKYGQLVHIDEASTASSRIHNDEYDKESAHDFALWKTAKEGEPSWAFNLDGHTLDGRPGWHIECSAMSRKLIGQPFDIHTGGIDLKFPHHENEIAQSTACTEDPLMARFFIHNEHVLVDGKKMSKSLGNFYTLRDLEEKGYEPGAFRMLVLQGNYQNSVSFSWDNLETSQNMLTSWRISSAMRWQLPETGKSTTDDEVKILDALSNDLNSSLAITIINEVMNDAINEKLSGKSFSQFVLTIDALLGLELTRFTPNISEEAYGLLKKREKARAEKNYSLSDELRGELGGTLHNVGVRDSANGQRWYYTDHYKPE